MTNDWMNPQADALDAAATSAAAPLAASAPLTERRLRRMDLALAVLAAALLVMGFPLLLWALISGERRRERRMGAQGRAFDMHTWSFANNLNGRLLSRLGARSWPLLINVLRGEMAWVGPRARCIDEPAGPAAALRPGLTGLHQLRVATSVDFVSEVRSEAEYVSQRGVSHDLRLLVLGSWHGAGSHTPETADEPPAQVQILDATVHNLSMDSALQTVLNHIATGTHAKVAFVNPACANIAAGSRAYRRDLAACDLVLPDGIGMKIAASWLGTPIRQNVNGTDFFPRLCTAMSAQRQRLYLVGARPEVVARVAEVVRERWPAIELVGAQHGYFQPAQESSIAQDIRESGAQVVLVAMGVPAQESFIARMGGSMGPCVAIGVGGLFDFVAGRISRAPQWMRDAGLEWTWRLIQEPGRMWQRYLVGNFSFLARVAMQQWGWRKAQKPRAKAAGPAPALTGRSAVLLATHAIDTGTGSHLAASLPLGPASFAETLVAQLASQSVRQIHVLLSSDGASSQTLQRQLGDGQRWGVRIHWHQSAQAEAPYQPLRAVAEGQTEPLLLINAHSWLSADGMARMLRDPQAAVRMDDQGQAWQGWACVTPDDLRALGHSAHAADLESRLLSQAGGRYIPMAADIASAHSRASWLAAQTAVPAKALVALQTDVWTAHPWGYASAHAHIDADAHIEGPVWIGPGCVVQADAHIGPHTNLTTNVIVEKNAALANAVAMPEAFVSASTDATEGVCVAQATEEDRAFDRMFPAPRVQAAATTTAPSANRLGSAAGRWLAKLTVALLAPLMLPLMGLRKILGLPAAWEGQRVVLGRAHVGARLVTATLRQPTGPQRRSARLLAWYGALLDVAQGRRQWVGVRARRVEQWFALDSETRAALSFAPIGLWHPAAWTNRFDCVLRSEAVADRLWLVRRTGPGARWSLQRWVTGQTPYRELTAS